MIKYKELKNGEGYVAIVGKGKLKRAALGKWSSDALRELNSRLFQETVSLQEEIKALRLRCRLLENK